MKRFESNGMFVVCAAGLLAVVLSGCMTSRGLCTIHVNGDARRTETKSHYAISQIREQTEDGRSVAVHSNWRMCEMLDGPRAVAELMSYAPGTFAENGVPVTVTFRNWRKAAPLHWSVVPCMLTLGICPYFQHEESHSDVIVTRDDGRGGNVSFSYDESDDWKISILFAFGSIPYSEKTITKNEFQAGGHGDGLSKSLLEGIGKGIAVVLSDQERASSLKEVQNK